jgi:hypothetical protein
VWFEEPTVDGIYQAPTKAQRVEQIAKTPHVREDSG